MQCQRLSFFMFLALIRLPFNERYDISEKQKENAELAFNKYASALTEFSHGKNIGAQELSRYKKDIQDVVDEDHYSHTTHYYDLNLLQNREDITSDEDMMDWWAYLAQINNEFKLELEIEFTNVETICIDKSDIIIQFNKKLIYKGKSATISEVAVINLPSDEKNSPEYKIKYIQSARSYKIESEKCGSLIRVSNEDVEVTKKIKDANDYFFEKKEYLNAKNLYDYINTKNPDNNYIKKQIELCKGYITQSDYSDKALNSFNNSEFEKAQYWYEKLLKEFVSQLDTNDIRKRIAECKSKYIDQQYNQSVKIADLAVVNHDYNEARNNYERALMIKPGDKYARSKLEESKEVDDVYARKQIEMAIDKYYKNGNYGQYFNILRKYEGYGNHKRLSAKQYYFIVMFLALQKEDFKIQSGLDGRTCRQYCRIYCKNLKDALYREPYFEFSLEAERLLLRINKKNQF